MNQKNVLSTVLEDGRIELSNNRAENAIRPFVVGRMAILNTPSAVAYSIVETAKANHLNVYMYLVHIFSKLPGLDFRNNPALLESFLPWSEQLPDGCRLTQQ